MSTVRFNNIFEAIKGFKKTYSIFALGSIFQHLKIGMIRQEVEHLLGKPTNNPQPIINNTNLYAISGLDTTVPIYLVMSFDGKDDARLETDRLVSFELFPISE